jgi:hypothetical protein
MSRGGIVAVDLETQKAWARTWQITGEALEKIRRVELRALTAEKALAATDNLLSLGAGLALSAKRRCTSGLVEQQRLFARLRP